MEIFIKSETREYKEGKYSLILSDEFEAYMDYMESGMMERAYSRTIREYIN